MMGRSRFDRFSSQSSRPVRGAENIIPNTSLSFTPKGCTE